MSQATTSASTSNDRVVAPDVLIIGGGVQGLWLLNDLGQHGYEALLLERHDLGGEQTCHSHVYLHRGHMYNVMENQLVGRLAEVTKMWDDWMARHSPEIEADGSLFGYQATSAGEKKADLWKSFDLKFRLAPKIPDVLRGGAINYVLQSNERCLNGQWLVSELQRECTTAISHIEAVHRIEVDKAVERVEQVEVRMSRGQNLVFRPHSLVLAAGRGNQELLDLASGGDRELHGRLRDKQQIRKAHMLVVRGSQEDLQLLPQSGVFPELQGLFIVPRNRNGERVWLVSDHTSPSVSFPDEWIRTDARSWLPPVIAALGKLAPDSFAHPERLQWGVYEAPKTEGRASGGGPHEERIEQFYKIDNLWAVWPTKLTLAPLVSKEVVKQYVAYRTAHSFAPDISPAWTQHRREAAVAPERWQITPLLSWAEFRRCHRLPM